MGGPPLVLWLNAHDWSTQRIRALLATLFLLLVPWQLAVYYLRFGAPILHMMALAAAYMPLVVLGGWSGNVCGDRLPRRQLRSLSYALLLAIAMFSILEPLW
jgi:hypothetical protein